MSGVDLAEWAREHGIPRQQPGAGKVERGEAAPWFGAERKDPRDVEPRPRDLQGTDNTENGKVTWYFTPVAAENPKISFRDD